MYDVWICNTMLKNLINIYALQVCGRFIPNWYLIYAVGFQIIAGLVVSWFYICVWIFCPGFNLLERFFDSVLWHQPRCLCLVSIVISFAVSCKIEALDDMSVTKAWWSTCLCWTWFVWCLFMNTKCCYCFKI